MGAVVSRGLVLPQLAQPFDRQEKHCVISYLWLFGRQKAAGVGAAGFGSGYK
jgi:hypothetical protein